MCSINCEPGLHEFYLGLIQDAGFRPRVVQEATHIQTQVGLVAAGVGISLVPSSAASLQQAGVVYRPLSVPQARLSKLMVWRKGPCPVHLTGFLGAVQQAAALLRTSAAIRRACRPAPEERCLAARYQPRIHAKMSGATIVASDSITYFGVSSESLPQVIFSFGTAPE